MKKLFLTLIVLLFATTVHSAEFADTVLDTPENIKEPAVSYKLYSFEWYSYKMVANYNLVDSTGNLVDSRSCTIEDWSEITVPASCSDVQYTNQTDCTDNGEVWTPATVVDHTDFTTLHTATVAAGKVGQQYKNIVAQALSTTCKGARYLNISGTVE